MADTVTSTLIENGPNCWAYQFTSLSDGTGESGVVKVDGSSSGPLGVVIAGQTLYPGIHLKIREIEYDVKSMGLVIQWGASSPYNILTLGGFNRLKFQREGGLFIPSGLAGATGQILFTTTGAMINSSYTVYLRGTKGIHQ